MRRLCALLGLLALLVLAGCGGSAVTKTLTKTLTKTVALGAQTPTANQLAKECPSGQSFMGCSSGAVAKPTAPPSGRLLAPLALPSGELFPDVSQWQGCSINWPAVNTKGAVIKASELSQDPCYSHNVTSLRSAHKVVIPYDFVRSCSASAFISAVNRTQGRPPAAVIDEEVPAAANCTGTLVAQIKRAWPGITVDEYTAPGTEQAGASSGSPPLWIADYGSGFPCLWTCHPVAWQFAAPPYAYVRIAGLGEYTDVSVDYGLLEQGAAPASVFSIFPPLRLATPEGISSERLTAEQLDGALQHAARFASYLRNVLEPRAAWFARRIAYLAFHVWPRPRPDWSAPNRREPAGSRYQYLLELSHGKRIG